jgi:hypothetical protein
VVTPLAISWGSNKSSAGGGVERRQPDSRSKGVKGAGQNEVKLFGIHLIGDEPRHLLVELSQRRLERKRYLTAEIQKSTLTTTYNGSKSP